MPPRLRPLLALALLAFAAAVHADFPIGQQQTGAVPVIAQRALTACSRTDCLAIWTDARSGRPGVVAIRTTPSTTAERPFRLALPDDVVPIALASDGTDYLVSCLDQRTATINLLFAHVDTQNGISLHSGGSDSSATYRELLWLGDAYVQLFQRPDGTHAVIVDREGRRVRLDVLLASSGSKVPIAAATADRLTLLWPGAGGVYQSRSFLLREISDPGFPASMIGAPAGVVTKAAVASSGTNLLMTWVESATSGPKGFARLLNTDGTQLTGTFALPLAPDDVVWSGNVYLALAANAGGVRGPQLDAVRIDKSGALRDAAPVAFANAGEHETLADAAPAAGGALVIWYDSISASTTLRGTFTDAAGQRRNGASTDPGLLLSRGLPPQRSGAAVTRNNEKLIAWVEESDVQRVLVARYDAAGRQLTFAPSAARNTLAAQYSPVLATDGHGALLVWYEATSDPQRASLYGMWIAEGATTGEAELIDTVDAGAPPAAVVSNGRQFVAAWQHAGTRQLFLARWSADGHRVDSTPIPLAPPRTVSPSSIFPLGDSYPALAWNGQDYYLVFGHELVSNATVLLFPLIVRELHGVRLSESLLPVGPERLISDAATGSNDARSPDVIAAPNGFVIAWLQQRTFEDVTLVLATRRVSATDEVFPAHGRERGFEAKPILVRAVNELRLAYGASLYTLDGDGAIIGERALDAPVVDATFDGAAVLLLEQRLAENSLRLFGVSLSPPRVRVVRH